MTRAQMCEMILIVTSHCHTACQYRRMPAEILARRSSRCSAHAFFVAADNLSRPLVAGR
jgi:hypothetical protein